MSNVNTRKSRTAPKKAGARINTQKIIEVDMDDADAQVTANSQTAKKPTLKEIEKLKREVHAQNRKLLLICAAILLAAVAILFSASHIAEWLAPEQWSYETATKQVLAGVENENQYLYNGLVFARQSNESLWLFQGNVRGKLYEITMYYGPNEVSDIRSSDLAFAQIFNKRAVILTLNTDLDNVPTGAAYGAIAAIELGKVLGTKNDILNKQVISMLTNQTAAYNSSFTATCANASKDIGIIQIELAEKTQIVARPNCVLIRGSEPSELVRAADRYVYSLLGVIPLESSTQSKTNASSSVNATATTTDDDFVNATQAPDNTSTGTV